jgi:hypothetical protein
MKGFIVKAIIRTTETWEIYARDEAEAGKLFEEGVLLSTGEYKLERILSVETVDTASNPL